MMGKKQFEILVDAVKKIREITDNETVFAMSYSCFAMVCTNGLVERRVNFDSCGLITRYFVSGTEIFVHPELPKDTFCIMTRKEHDEMVEQLTNKK